jgi:ethanolamine permease
MGWSMFLECLFAAIGTAIATGGSIYFIVSLLGVTASESAVTTAAALVTVAAFAALQCLGVKEQARLMVWMTYGAIVGLIWFWLACLPGVDVDRILQKPLLPNGWSGVSAAIPFALWWLVIIETVALTAEEADQPERTIPLGLSLAQITLIILVLFTWFFASAAGSDYTVTGDPSNLFPLSGVYREVWTGSRHLAHVAGFSIVAVCGMIASYNGMIFAVSRQAFSLGRAGYLPRIFGTVHRTRRTPTVAIVSLSAVVAAFVVWGYFNAGAVMVAVLTCNLTALVWYVLAMGCLFLLRVREPNMPRPYRVPGYPWLPAAVVVMSLVAAGAYSWYSDTIVLWLTLAMYALGLGYFFLVARTRLEHAAPEELAARGSASPPA